MEGKARIGSRKSIFGQYRDSQASARIFPRETGVPARGRKEREQSFLRECEVRATCVRKRAPAADELHQRALVDALCVIYRRKEEREREREES